jgi:choline kinase
MKLVILAAGRGERLMPLTRNTPKPLLDLGNGNTLLEEQIVSIRASGTIDEIIVVVGYLADQVETKIRFYKDRGLNIVTEYNPFWEVSNNLMSLWIARNSVRDEDFMITNGDNIFAPDVFQGLASNHQEGIWLAVCPKTGFDFDDMKVRLEGSLVAQVSKQLSADEASAESPGLAMIRGSRARNNFFEHLNSLARESVNLKKFWLEIFNRLYEKGISVYPWSFEAHGHWQELDFHMDVDKVRSLLAEKIMMIRSIT